MMEMIGVTEQEPLPRGRYKVTITADGGEQSVHTVWVDVEYIQQLGFEQHTVADLLSQTFHFLLSREPKEAILREFELRQVAEYFPDYIEHLQR